MKTKLVVALALGAVGVGALVYSFGLVGGGSTALTQYLTEIASIGDVTDDVASTGTLETTASYGLAFGADPYLLTGDDAGPTAETTWPVTDVAVAVGDRVAAGDVLATADTADVEAKLDAARNALSSARISLRAARATLEAQNLSQEASPEVDEADAELLARYVDAFQRYGFPEPPQPHNHPCRPDHPGDSSAGLNRVGGGTTDRRRRNCRRSLFRNRSHRFPSRD